MKSLTIFTAAFVAASVSFAKNSVTPVESVQPTLEQIKNLETVGDKKSALILSVQASQQMALAIGLNEVVQTIDSQVTELREEIVTSHVSQKGGFSILFGLLGGAAQRHWDTATIVTTNPQDVAGFGAKVAADYLKLQKNLKNYVKQNELALVYQKAFAVKALQLATQLPAAERASYIEAVSVAWQQAQLMTFLGAQNISQCVVTNYANRSHGWGFSLSGLLLSLDLSEEVNQYAHTEQACSGSSRVIEVSDEALTSAKIFAVETAGQKYYQKLGQQELFEKAAPYYPTWGNPYYR